MQYSSTPSAEPPVYWFCNFHGFQYNSTADIKSNFNRLAIQRQWGSRLKGRRWIECQTALFDNLYGTDTSKLEIWQDLCREVHIKNPPNSITGCRKLLGSRKVLVNLVNLIDHRITGVGVIRFKNYGEFCAYTAQGRRFPLAAAKQDGFISALLRKL